MTARPVSNWPRAMARRLGMGGEVQFTRAAVGQTLHLYCGGGDHIVDVHIAANQHPDAIAKKLLGQGWSVGSKLKCPEHSRRKEKTEKPRRAKLLSETAPRSMRLSHIADKILSGEVAVMVEEEADDVKLTRNQRRVVDKIIAKEQPVVKAEIKTEKGNKMPEAKQAPSVPTEAAKKAKRMVYLMLEEQYDDVNNRYRSGWDDRKISLETGASINLVVSVREESFGPLGEPSEFADLRAQIAAHRVACAEGITEIKRGFAALETRFNGICMKNGWPNV